MPLRALAWLFAVGVASVVGCGPAGYLTQVTRRAATAVEAAQAAGAEKLAPYEYTAAVEYLHKAREEAGYAEYQEAVVFGKKAEALAKRARTLAAERARAESGPRP